MRFAHLNLSYKFKMLLALYH